MEFGHALPCSQATRLSLIILRTIGSFERRLFVRSLLSAARAQVFREAATADLSKRRKNGER